MGGHRDSLAVLGILAAGNFLQGMKVAAYKGLPDTLHTGKRHPEY